MTDNIFYNYYEKEILNKLSFISDRKQYPMPKQRCNYSREHVVDTHSTFLEMMQNIFRATL